MNGMPPVKLSSSILTAPARISGRAITWALLTLSISSSTFLPTWCTAPSVTASSPTNGGSQPAAAISVRPAFLIRTATIIRGRAVSWESGSDQGNYAQPPEAHFLDGDRLLLSFVAHSAAAVLAPRGAPAGEYQLDAVVVSAATGKILTEAHWPAYSRYTRVAAVNSAGFVELSADRLTLIRPDLVIAKVAGIPTPRPYRRDSNLEPAYIPSASHDGKRMLLWTDFRAPGPWLWFDAENLQLLTEVQSVPSRIDVFVSDDRLWTWESRTGNTITRLPLGRWRIFAPLASQGLAVTCIASLGRDFVLCGQTGAVGPNLPIKVGATIISADGTRHWLISNQPGGGSPMAAATARNNRRFTILTGTQTGGIGWLDVDSHTELKGLLIYDAPFDAQAYPLLVRGSKAKNIYSQVLSPDGKYLAVLGNNGILEIYDLPPIRTR